ncbi:MAG: PSD1 and planctomycete cytochrome C domain-containing protein [Verrucomicrobia bacterium]|nr:PSD1 and planctomycete cytochrome C domain-containing protein [Verrucomicrobiota bacterium]
MPFSLLRSLPTALAAALLCTPGLLAEEPVDFNDHIRPLLSDRCFTCHGFDANAREADLRLDTPEGAFGKREKGDPAIVPGKPNASPLWQRVIASDPDDVMPPPDFLRQLSTEEKKLIKRWIEEGANYEPHWTFVPVEKPEVDPAQGHPVDQLVTRRLNKEGLTLSKQADKHTLARRLSFDLRGLPPTPRELENFLNDSSPEAWNKLVDLYLADPAFGERMAWPWLEAARYADTNGFEGDRDRTMWPWRDWVIEAFNKNLPYDDFTTWQIAGDLLPDPTYEQQLATGFLRNHSINGEGGSIPEENRVNYVMDMAETVGTVWMGLTFNCCRCHDHKYDPLTQKEYYGLTDFFNQTPVDGSGGNAQTPPVLAALSATQRATEETLTEELQAIRATVPDNPTRATAIEKQLGDLRKNAPKVMIMADRQERRQTHILAIGSYEAPGQEVSALTPAFLPPLQRDRPDQPANRLDLARWLVSPEHPLTSRVTVNRLWQELFGIGLVKSPEDFGVQSEIPVHPALLDWLAADFMEHDWDFKHLIRTIVTSNTYRQSAEVSSTLLERDPANRLLARGPRFRLPFWMIRDQALAVSGRLIAQQGGEPVKPWQPPGLWAEATFGYKRYTPDTGDKIRRRSLYTFWRRISAPPMFFDSAKRERCEVGSNRTNSPLHALATLNDPLYAEAARALAARAVTESSPDPATALSRAFNILLARTPGQAERAILLANFEDAKALFAASPADAEAFLSIGETPRHPDLDTISHAALAVVCLSLLNTDEALTKE